MIIEVEDKEYKLGYPTRKSIKIAEQEGLDVINNMGKVVSMTDKLFYTGLLAFQEDITEEEAEELLVKYIEAGGNSQEILDFLSKQYMGFIKSPKVKTKKKAKIIEV